jgi:hypothetical protein
MVLGMHRSGTSAATGLISLLGLSPCISEDLMMGTRTNAKGHWESGSMFRLNDRLLAETGHTWWYPPTVEELDRWERSRDAKTFDESREIFDRVHPIEPWVWKDPRACLTLSFWRHALSRPVAGVVVFRNPLDVANSLERRDHMPVEFSVALWMRYTRALLEQAHGMPMLVSPYDDIVSDPWQWSRTVRTFLSGLGVTALPEVNQRSVRRFVDPKLSHSSHSREELATALGDANSADLYDTLCGLTGMHTAFAPPALDAEPSWVEDQLDAVGPEWHSAWKVPGSVPPSLNYRIRALMKRAVSLSR